ncbi:phosphotransferase family protein [Rhodococcus wratislaviensis]|uniref:Aminoglycoside phosphotransferase domain-containing protein n=1 Tax=Rhodococcus wratislaviensis NBRC 100605 TaxID=1219028 RepID=X0PWG3_RHOWR|nr:phosphotransferase family protein [Rhodococcus wratislaviensis]GAF47633.1 hypothetical protein RW1_043_00680 [Rhodococcus wratislaviensis NBRC 100605]
MTPPVGSNALLDPSWRPDVEKITRDLASWLDRCAPDLGTIAAARFPDEGGSSFNLLFDTERPDGSTGSYVAKLGSPASYFVTFPDENLGRQRRVVELVRSVGGLPAPEVLHHEDDEAWLGAPFFIMPRYPGRPWPSDPPYNFAGWVKDASAQSRRAMQDAFVDVLTGVHSVTTATSDLAFLERPDLGATPLAAQVGYLDQYYEWARAGARFPIVERSLAWLREHLPTRTEAGCLTWGDARAGNLLFDRERVTAVLDWEGAALGHPEVDVAFCEVMHRYYQLRAESHGFDGLPDLFRGEDLASQYAARTGRELRDLQWYRVLGATRAATIQVRFVCRPLPAKAGGTSELRDDSRLTIAPLLRHLLDNSPSRTRTEGIRP